MKRKLTYLIGLLVFISQYTFGQSTISVKISSSTDDAEEYIGTPLNDDFRPDGSMDITSSDIELGAEEQGGKNPQISGLRFASVGIPEDATILSAYIQFTVDNTSKNEDPAEYFVFSENDPNPATFGEGDYDITSRTWLEDSVAWNVAEGTWSEAGAAGEDERTSDITSLVQQLVDNPEWSEGNAMAFFFKGNGVREAESFDGSENDAAVLVVEYQVIANKTYQVSSSSDDAEEYIGTPINDDFRPDGSMDITSSDIELGAEEQGGKNPQISGLRFTSIDIPANETILSAYIQFTVDNTSKNEDPAKYYVFAEDNPNPVSFQDEDYNITSRTWLDDSVQWNVPAGTWDVAGEAGEDQRTADITSLVQALVNKGGWAPGNAMAFYIKGEGVREAESFDGSEPDAARLVIEYIQTEIIYNPELVREIPDQEIVNGWDFSLDLYPFFIDRDSELSLSANEVGEAGLPAGLSLDSTVLSGVLSTTGTFSIAVTAESEGFSVSDTFDINVIDASGDFTLAIFHNNDGESDMLPDSIEVNGVPTTGGSIGQFKATLDSLRAQAAARGYESVMLSSGDNFLAGLEYNASQANGIYYDALALDALDYDAIAIGNHDFDFGTQVLSELINSFSVNPAPYLSANLSFENVPELQALVDAGRIKSSTVVTVGSEEIGVVGLTTPRIDVISSPGNTTISADIVDSLQRQVDLLTAEGINKIILISHLQNYEEDLELAAQVTGVDIIIAGGGDELLTNNPDLGKPFNTPVTDIYPVVTKDADDKDVYLVTTPGNYRYLGNLLVDFDENGVVTKVYQSDPVLVYGATDADIVATIEEPIITYIGDLSTTVIATAQDTLDYLRESLRGKETNGGNLFADALLWQAKKDFASFGVKEPQVAIQNSGGLRIETLVLPGDFTEDLTYEIAAFTNIVSVVEDISPEKFLELIEHGVSEAPTLDGRFPQIAGFKVVYYQGEPEGTPGVKSIMLDDGTMIVENGEVVEGAPDITLATIDFTAGGGDGYPFAPLTFTTLGATYQQAFRNYLADEDGLNGVIPESLYPYNAPPSRIIAEIYESPAVQSVLVNEDFNGCETGLPADWIIYSVSSNADWSCNENGASGEAGDYGVEMNGYGADEASEDWLISPRITLEEGKSYFLNFNSMLRYGGPALEVYYSSDYSGSGDPNAATWTLFQEATDAVDAFDSWDYVNSGDISLDALSGQVYIAFKYTSTGTGGGDGAIYRIDDVVVKTDVLLYENFNDICANENYAPAGWTVAELGTPGIVSCSSEGFEDDANDYSLQCNGYSVGAGEVWVISPLLGLGATDYALSFASKVQYDGPMPVVLYSTDFSGVGDPNEATWTEITEASEAITTSFIMSPEIDLSFIEEDAYIAFKYVSEGSSGGQSRIFLLDEVMISEPGEIVDAGEVTIAQIQGTMEESPLVNNLVTTSGIVTAMFNGVEPYLGAGFNGNLAGFYLQDPNGDGDDSTSEGILVDSDDPVAVGDSVVVKGLVLELFGLTTITDLTSVEVISNGNTLPAPALVTLPLESAESFESYESMLVEIDNEMTVTENRNLENFGEVRLSAGGLLVQPTQVVDPNDSDPEGVTASGNSNVNAVTEFQEMNDANNFILDDARSGSNPDPIPFTDENGTLLAGSTVTDLTGIMSYSFGNYRLIPTEAPNFGYASREDVPVIEDATLKVVAFNVLNYFNGDGQGGGFPTSRGAQTTDEFEKQTQKIVAALAAIDGDVVGLMEIENDANDGFSAIKDLVDALNTEIGSEDYDFVSTGIIAPAAAAADEIKVGFIYKTSTVELVGDYAILNNSFDPAFNDDYSRPALAQTFMQKSTNAKFTAVVNHLKSKGSGCDAIGDPNDSDGQGNCNVTRTVAAGTLATWLESDPTGSGDEDFIILGDLNAYGQEDPIDTLRARGYTSVIPVSDYSYVFDGQHGTLDYGMVNGSMLEQVAGAAIWHINSIEPDMFSYYGVEEVFNADPYRSSDHDPVIIGLDMEDPTTGIDLLSVSNNVSVFPNPFNDELNIRMNAKQDMVVTLEIRNSVGSVISQREFSLIEGENTIRLDDVAGYQKGVYYLFIKELDVKTVIVK